MTQKSLDAKLARIHADPQGARDFILADAKDADMAMGIQAPGSAWDGERDRLRSLADYREQMREVGRQALVDILLMSASSHASAGSGGTAVRRLACDGSCSRQRHHRYSYGTRRMLSARAVNAFSIRHAGTAPVWACHLQR